MYTVTFAFTVLLIVLGFVKSFIMMVFQIYSRPRMMTATESGGPDISTKYQKLATEYAKLRLMIII